MKKPLLSLFLALLALPALHCAAADRPERIPVGEPTAKPAGDGWIDLFAPERAGDWANVTDKKDGIFSIADGQMVITGTKPTRYIAYQGETFGDFELHVEFKTGADANSGVFFRTDPSDPVQKGMEVQIMTDHGVAPNRQGSGSLYDVATPMWNMVRPMGEWNSYDITCQGSKLVVVLNGWRVLDIDLATLTMPIGKFDTPLAELPRTGHVILQDHGGAVTFRNLLIRKL
jgi:hypothetical protein